MLLVYSYCSGTRRQQWMPFWPPFLTAGKQFVKNRISSKNKSTMLLFYCFKLNPAYAPWLTPLEEVACIRLGRSIDFTP
jgi:hypothetical protein